MSYNFQKVRVFSFTVLIFLPILLAGIITQYPRTKKIIFQANNREPYIPFCPGFIPDTLVNPDSIYDAISIDVSPEYAGSDSIHRVLKKNIRYPSASRSKKIQGTVWIRILISKKGTAENIEIIRQPKNGDELSREALRVAKKFKRWTPGKHHGITVKSYYYIPVRFLLSD